MTRVQDASAHGEVPVARGPLLATLILALACCSCRAHLGARAALAPEISAPGCDNVDPTACVADVGPALPVADAPPLPYQAHGSWIPPGIARPWPTDEYLFDGGDDGLPVAVSPEWTVYGLEMEDTIAHFDTVDGRTLVEPSNKVVLYAPRFGAVRTVTRLGINEQSDQVGDVELPVKVVRHDEVAIPTSSLQRVAADRQASARLAGVFEMRQGDGALSQTLVPAGFQDTFLPYENLSIMRTGQFANSEKARLAAAVQAAITWTADAAVQVVIDNVAAHAATGDRKAQATFTVDDLRQPKLRVIKVASTQTAVPGETVDFTIRYDNVGTQTIGNVVLLDNLTTRLEYVPDTAQSSRAAAFSTRPNDGESVILRWELDDPLEAGEGGVLRFRCVVR